MWDPPDHRLQADELLSSKSRVRVALGAPPYLGFWFRFVSLLVSGSPGLSYMDWHALDFSASFLAVGGAMAFVLIGATRSATRSSVA